MATRRAPYPPPVAAFDVKNQVPIVRTHTATGPLLMAGDGEGLVDAAAVGLLDARQGSFFSASYAADQAGFDTIYDAGADLLVTDTNRSGPSGGAPSARTPATPSGPTRSRPTTPPTSGSRCSPTRPTPTRPSASSAAASW